VILQVHPAIVRAVGTADELQALHEELTYDLGKRRGRAERMCLYDPMTRSFPIGLLPPGPRFPRRTLARLPDRTFRLALPRRWCLRRTHAC